MVQVEPNWTYGQNYEYVETHLLRIVRRRLKRQHPTTYHQKIMKHGCNRYFESHQRRFSIKNMNNVLRNGGPMYAEFRAMLCVSILIYCASFRNACAGDGNDLYRHHQRYSNSRQTSAHFCVFVGACGGVQAAAPMLGWWVRGVCLCFSPSECVLDCRLYSRVYEFIHSFYIIEWVGRRVHVCERSGLFGKARNRILDRRRIYV